MRTQTFMYVGRWAARIKYLKPIHNFWDTHLKPLSANFTLI